MSEPMAELITSLVRPRGPSRNALATLEGITQRAIDGDLAALAIAFTVKDGRPGSAVAIDAGGDLFQVIAALSLALHRIEATVTDTVPQQG